jgi:hypothetical protein
MNNCFLVISPLLVDALDSLPSPTERSPFRQGKQAWEKYIAIIEGELVIFAFQEKKSAAWSSNQLWISNRLFSAAERVSVFSFKTC